MRNSINEIKVSVIVPVYNIEKYIERCLLSLVNQTLKEIEIICVDDGSTDRSHQILQRMQADYPEKITVLSIENSGVSAARNLGLATAKGEYIGFVDGDDYVRSDMFERLYGKAAEDEADIVSSSYVTVFEKRSGVMHSGNMHNYGKSLYECPELLTCDVSFLWNKIFKRSMIEEYELKFADYKIFEDLLFVDSSFLVAKKISKVDEPFYYYRRVRIGSATNGFSKNYFNLFEVLEELFDFFKKHNAYEHFSDVLLFLTLNHTIIRHKTVVSDNQKAIDLKLEFLEASFDFLYKHFPDWKSNDYYFSLRNANKVCYTDKKYWTEYIKYAAISNLTGEKKERAAQIKAMGMNVQPAPAMPSKDKIAEEKNILNNFELGIEYRKYCKRKRIDKKAILLDSQHGENINGNMFWILKKLMTDSKYSGFTVYVSYYTNKKNAFVEKLSYYGLYPRIVDCRSKEYAKLLASCKYLFNDTSFPTFFCKREGQVYLNTWHGTALKTLGISSKKEVHRIGNLQKNFCSADYVLCPNEHMKNVFSKDYYVDTLSKNTRFLFSGYPRNGIFFEGANQKIIEENGLTGKQIIAYMPTWRGAVESVEEDKTNDYLIAIDNQLRDNQIMYVNLHPYVNDLVDYSQFKNIRPVPAKYEIYDFLNCCDVLVTDYSSVFFDFAVKKKKIILFTYDKDEYLSDRGMYFSLSQFPFRSVETVDELIDAINDDNDADTSAFINEFCRYDNLNVVAEILDYILFGKGFDTNIYVEKRPEKKKENVLVFAGNLYNNLHQDNLYKSICKSDPSCNYTITFLTRVLGRNYSAINAFPNDAKSYSILGNIMYVKASEKEKLNKAFKDYKYFNKHKKKFLSYCQEEFERLYGFMDIDRVICFGGKSEIILSILSCASCKKVMLIPTMNTFNENLNQTIYDRFDEICYKQKAVGVQLKNTDSNIKRISDYKDVFEK